MRRPAQQGPRGPRNSIASLPAPTGGWDSDSPLALMKEDRASVLDNWFPSAEGIELRKGFWRHAATGVASPIETLMPYHPALDAGDRLFAACADRIFDVTSRGFAPIQMLSGLANARWQHVNISNEGGQFLWICNGADTPRVYNGAAWTTAALTGMAGTDIINVTAHKKRLWFVKRNSLTAGYLPVNAIQGAVVPFPLDGVFTKGGSLVSIGSWSTDAGEGGLDDLIVFVTSRGQVAIYQGTNPDTDFEIVGVWDFSPPLGRRCILRVANDLALITQEGVIPISLALKTERGALAAVALTKKIRNAMSLHARLYGRNFGWQLISHPTGNMAILNVPISESGVSDQFVMNTLTGAWCRFKGQNAVCWANFQDGVFFGGHDGAVYQADVADTDFGQDLVADLRGAFSSLRRPGLQKVFSLLKPIYTTDGALTPAVGIDVDYGAGGAVMNASSGSADASAAIWDTSDWDSADWSDDVATISEWAGISGVGEVAAIRARLVVTGRSDGAFGPPPFFQMNGFSIAYEAGGGL